MHEYCESEEILRQPSLKKEIGKLNWMHWMYFSNKKEMTLTHVTLSNCNSETDNTTLKKEQIRKNLEGKLDVKMPKFSILRRCQQYIGGVSSSWVSYT